MVSCVMIKIYQRTVVMVVWEQYLQVRANAGKVGVRWYVGTPDES